MGPPNGLLGGRRPVGSAGPLLGLLGPSFWLMSPNGHMTDDLGVLGQILLEKMFKIFSQRILKLKKYFWYFYKKGKMCWKDVVEKI